jgi:hypothetical protein
MSHDVHIRLISQIPQRKLKALRLMTEEKSPEVEWTTTGLFYQPSFRMPTTRDYWDTAFQLTKEDIRAFIFRFSGVRYAQDRVLLFKEQTGAISEG